MERHREADQSKRCAQERAQALRRQLLKERSEWHRHSRQEQEAQRRAKLMQNKEAEEDRMVRHQVSKLQQYAVIVSKKTQARARS